jgi:PAS domain S-box-containing protein
MDSAPPETLEQLRAEIQRLRARIATLEASSETAALITGHMPYEQPIWFDAVSDAIIVADTTWHVQAWNHAAEQLYGWSRAEAVGRAVSDVITVARHLDGQSRAVARQTLMTEGAWRGTFIHHAHDGRELMVEGVARAIIDAQGTLTGHIGINRDVTAQVTAQQATQRAAKRLQVLADASHAFAEAEADDQVVLEQIAHISADALVAGCVIRLCADDGPWLDTITVYDHDPALQTAVADHFLHTRIPLDGPNPAAVAVRSGQALLMPRIDPEVVRARVAPALWSALARVQVHSGMIAPLRAHGQILGVLSFARYAPEQPAFSQDDLTLAQDLADRAALAIHNMRLYRQAQAAQQAAAEAHARLDALINNMPSGIGYLDRDLCYQLVNPALAAINGRTPAEHLGRTLADLLPSLAQRLEPILRQVLTTGDAIRDRELHGRAHPQDSVARDWLISYFPVPGPAGEVAGIGVSITDITQSKRAAAALQASTAKLMAALESMTDAVFISDVDGRFIEFNHAFATLHKFKTKDACATTFAEYPAFLDAFSPTGAVIPLEQWAVPRALRGETAMNVECTLRRRDTGETWVASYSFAPIRDQDGTIIGSVVVGRDMTERMQAEVALRESEARYRTLFETMGQGVVYQDADGQIIDANFAAERILGQSLSQMQGRTSLDPRWHTIHEDGTPFPGTEHPAMVALRSGQEVSDVVMGVYHLATDAYRWISIQAVPQYLPRVTTPAQVYTIFEDITAQRTAQRALQIMHQQMEAIMESLDEGVIALRPDGSLAVLNAAARQFMLADADPTAAPATAQELIARSVMELCDADGQLIPRTKWPLMRVLHGEHFRNWDLRLRTPTVSEERWVSFSGMTIAAEDGRPALSIVARSDITQRKRDEAVVQAHAEALSRSNVELTRALRLKDEFLAMMSHELRTPLNAVLGITEALDEEIYGPISAQQRQALASVQESGRHLLGILSDILDLASIEAGQTTLDRVPIAVDDLCRSVLQLVEASAQQKGIRLRRSVEHGIAGVRADARRLTQILVNLLHNAVKFTPAGGSVGLDVSVGSGEDQIHFVVWDTGIGIAEADYARLFQPFTQVDGKLSRSYGGVGLGLTLVRRLVDLHGGSISLESTPGQGSRFTVSLSWADGENVAPVERREAWSHARAWTSPPRVVIADDHEPTLALYRELLTQEGCVVTVARTGTEAVAQVRATQPDVAILDIQMPEMDGLTAIRHIRADPEVGATPIIALTALAMPGDREACLAAGANAYLAKPVSLRTLIATITQVLTPDSVGEEPIGG